MANWLDKYEQGGLILKKKTKDNFGKKFNPNDVQASVGPGFVGLGYNTKGRNYSPAWGGQFAMGGSLPGAVGFTYARTQDPAPSNGKYAKKTKASAQNGQEMKFYQEGLDFTPKTISQNGLLMDKFKEEKLPSDATRVAAPIRPLTKKEQEENVKINKEYKKKNEELNKAIVADRKSRRETKGDVNVPGSFNIAEKLRLFPESVGGVGEMFDEYVNPAFMVGGLSDALGESIAAKSPEGVAATLAMTAGMGVLGIDPLGSAMKAQRFSKGAINNLGYDVQVAGNPFRGKGMPLREVDDVVAPRQDYTQYIQERNARNAAFDQSMAARRQQNSNAPVPYQFPTDEELLAMNTAEANRYFRRPAQPTNIQESISRISDAQRRAGADNISNPETQEIIQRELQNIQELSFRRGEETPQGFMQTSSENIPTRSSIEQQIAETQRRLAEVEARRAGLNTPSRTSRTFELDAIEEYYQRNPRPATPRTPTEAELADLRRQYPVDRNIQSNLQRAADDIFERTFTRQPQQITPAPQPQPMSESLQRALRDIDMEPSARDLDFISEDDLVAPTPRQSGGYEITDANMAAMNREPIEKQWSSDKFRIGGGNEPGTFVTKHPEGHNIYENVETYPSGHSKRTYDIRDANSNSQHIEIKTSQNPGDPYVNVNNVNFFNRNPNSSTKQMNIVFSHLPEKARISPINTSIHSQPLLNTRVAKLSNEPGRIQIEPAGMDNLNQITRGRSFDPDVWYDEVTTQFPKIERTYGTINRHTGSELAMPYLSYKNNPISFEQFKSPEFKRQLMDDGKTFLDVDVMVNKYKTIKNWKNGGQIVDPMGQWAHPGKITTIPSNDITMKGVNYDVLGVSNTGDKKLMKPGKNYKFDGDYVTEYPKGGWLNKYK